jgi:GTP cyclohydrolase I
VAYISNGRLLVFQNDRIIEYYSRPQVQERLTCKLCRSYNALGTQDVACVIDAKHLCVNSRGISDIESSTQ